MFVRRMGRGGGPPPSPGARSWSTSSSFSINDHHFMPPSIPLVIASSIISVSFQNIVFSSYHHNWKPSRQVRMCRRGQGATLSNWRRTCEPPSSYRWHQIREGFKNPSHGIRPLGGYPPPTPPLNGRENLGGKNNGKGRYLLPKEQSF